MLNSTDKTIIEFLSTPSGWRATKLRKTVYQHDVFLSTPSGWRATPGAKVAISYNGKFLSTPSGWRATIISYDNSKR